MYSELAGVGRYTFNRFSPIPEHIFHCLTFVHPITYLINRCLFWDTKELLTVFLFNLMPFYDICFYKRMLPVLVCACRWEFLVFSFILQLMALVF